MAKNNNVVPGDEEIVTKKGFLISPPPQQNRKKNPLSSLISANNADEGNKNDKSEKIFNNQKPRQSSQNNKNENSGSDKNENQRRNDRDGRSNDRRPPRGNNRGGQDAQANQGNSERKENANTNDGARFERKNSEQKNFERKNDGNARKKQYPRRDKQNENGAVTAQDSANETRENERTLPQNNDRRPQKGYPRKPQKRARQNQPGENSEQTVEREAKTQKISNDKPHNEKNRKFSDKNERGGKHERNDRSESNDRGEKNERNSNGNESRKSFGEKGRRDKQPQKRLSVLADLGFNSDSFTSRIREAEVENEPQETIDYSKAIPLRDQIYPPKKVETSPVENTDTENDTEKIEIIGVRFKEAGKIYYFDPDGNDVPYGTPVIVETARGLEYGFTAISNRFVPVGDVVLPLKKIIRLATADDKERLDANKQLEKSASSVFVEKVAKLGLDMHLVGVEYTFDNTKLLFYFSAEGRVDFRELVKELASVFRTRIELRQVGVRDEAKLLGGLGVCGRALCCKTFLGEFAQVSIKMAKDQNLSLNSSKISGTCGRLLCCLRYEDEVYRREYEITPRVDSIVETPDGKGVVTESNPLKGIIKVRLNDKSDMPPQPFHRDEVKIVGYVPRKKDDDADIVADDE